MGAYIDLNIAAIRRGELRTAFRLAVSTGNIRPFLYPWDLLPTFLLPALYLSIPHTRRPWLYRARFLVAAVIVALNLDILRNTSSIGSATSYASGLCASLGIAWALTVLVWTRPQFEAERVERRCREPDVEGDGSRRGIAGDQNGRSNGHLPESAHDKPKQRSQDAAQLHDTAPDEDVAKSLQDGYEYYWQSFPADAPFKARFSWALDLCWAWRGSGKIYLPFVSQQHS